VFVLKYIISTISGAYDAVVANEELNAFEAYDDVVANEELNAFEAYDDVPNNEPVNEVADQLPVTPYEPDS
jgi:hypothetical protein